MKYLSLTVRYLILSLWSVFSFFVMAWVLLNSFKNNRELFANIFGWPGGFNFSNYVVVWQANGIGVAFLNSVYVVVVAVVGILFVAAPAAYILARIEHKIVKVLTNFFAFGLGIPFQLIIIPLFFILLRLRLIGNLEGLILVYLTLSLPFSIFLLTSFYRTIPKELEESALIEGCSPAMTFWRIVLPASKAGLVPCAMLNLIGLWKEFLLALTFIDEVSRYTLSLGLYALRGSLQYTGNWVGIFAAFVVAMVPTFILFTFLSKVIVAGMTAGVSK